MRDWTKLFRNFQSPTVLTVASSVHTADTDKTSQDKTVLSYRLVGVGGVDYRHYSRSDGSGRQCIHDQASSYTDQNVAFWVSTSLNMAASCHSRQKCHWIENFYPLLFRSIFYQSTLSVLFEPVLVAKILPFKQHYLLFFNGVLMRRILCC